MMSTASEPTTASDARVGIDLKVEGAGEAGGVGRVCEGMNDGEEPA